MSVFLYALRGDTRPGYISGGGGGGGGVGGGGGGCGGGWGGVWQPCIIYIYIYMSVPSPCSDIALILDVLEPAGLNTGFTSSLVTGGLAPRVCFAETRHGLFA